MFKDLFYKRGYEYDHVFDWMITGPVDEEAVKKSKESLVVK